MSSPQTKESPNVATEQTTILSVPSMPPAITNPIEPAESPASPPTQDSTAAAAPTPPTAAPLSPSPAAAVPTHSRLKYPQCPKGGDHIGQLLNLVCLEPSCAQKSVICGICFQEQHRGHKIKPLKILYEHSSKYLREMTPMAIDMEKMKKTVGDTKIKLLDKFQEFKQYIDVSVTSVRGSVQNVFAKLIGQVELKADTNNQLLKTLEEISRQQVGRTQFIGLMQKLIAGVPEQLDPEGNSELSEQEVEKQVARIQKTVATEITKREENIRKEMGALLSTLQNLANAPIFDTRIDYKFSNQLRHTGISAISDTLAKSIDHYTYRFILLEPSIQIKGSRPLSVTFRIKESVSNWIAVGLCYREMVKNKKYQFEFSTLGHGAYMVSSNGGSWSSIDSTKNNVVTSFLYGCNDTIKVHYQPDQQKVTFTKVETKEKHVIQLEDRPQDQLHLCALFYYGSDQIEYLGEAE